MELYQELISRINVTEYEPQKACSLLSQLCPENRELFYALMVHHSAINKDCKHHLPYGTVVFDGGKGVRLKYASMPVSLRKVVSAFLDAVQADE